MFTPEFATLTHDLKAGEQNLNSACYNALFGLTLDARIQATKEAEALNRYMEGLLNNAFQAIHQLSNFMRQPGTGSVLQTASELSQVLEALRCQPTKAGMGAGSGAGCPTPCGAAACANLAGM